MQIFVADKSQLTVIRDLAYKIWPDAYGEILSEAQLDYMLENFYAIPALEKQMEMGHVFLLAEENDVFYGFASYEVNCKSTGKTKLHKIYVLTETQGKGVGKLLLSAVEKAAIKASNSHVFLNVNRYNNAQEFYKRLGFEIIHQEDIEIGQGYLMEDFVMEKPL
ncbi:GNAT family acetyltransferase [Flavobacterium enshiense DK69]|uniref:Acetyltransferase n=1 Tax=Flavobacterium enshiense DK69 TaxID=1107311 RepID=V6S767_9FLAO|nr:GNAT family N-acetyltransferase [Flavobacterium enshiense]ESU22239.1 GNAT family acetyltransferase [Flavobacterium enshiense DK69]KGO97251.1 acetyltransferase [Flavobacterium enshiense DK69]